MNLYHDPETPPQDLPMNQDKRDRLYEVARAHIGKDASPFDKSEDQLACVESLSEIIKEALPELKFPLLFSTKELYNHLTKSPSWREVDEPDYADIILTITGTGNGKVYHGHTGMVGRHRAADGGRWIMSNTSGNGLWLANYTRKTWAAYFETHGGMKSIFFRLS